MLWAFCHCACSTVIHKWKQVRPIVSTVLDELGQVDTVDTTTIFYKCLPCKIMERTLVNYGVSEDNYCQKFTARLDQKLISKDLFNKLLLEAPAKKELKDVYCIYPDE